MAPSPTTYSAPMTYGSAPQAIIKTRLTQPHTTHLVLDTRCLQLACRALSHKRGRLRLHARREYRGQSGAPTDVPESIDHTGGIFVSTLALND